MAYILNIESATDVCSICISDNDKILAVQETVSNHASQITMMIEKCLLEAHLKMKNLDAVAISNGPGSYTSLRIGASTAKGICYALDIPLIAVDTLKALALNAYLNLKDEEALYCPMIDARRMEVYTAVFKAEKNGLKLEEPMKPLIVETDTYNHYFDDNKRIIICGNGADKCSTIIDNKHLIFFKSICSSTYLVPLSIKLFFDKQFVDIAYYTPQYLKAPNITKPKNIL